MSTGSGPKIGVNGSEYENAGNIADDPYAAVAEAITEILPTVQVAEVSEFTDLDAGWRTVFPP